MPNPKPATSERKPRSEAAVRALQETRKLRAALVALAKTEGKGYAARRSARRVMSHELRELYKLVERCYPRPPHRPLMPSLVNVRDTGGGIGPLTQQRIQRWALRLAEYYKGNPERAVRSALAQWRKRYRKEPQLADVMKITEAIKAACTMTANDRALKLLETSAVPEPRAESNPSITYGGTPIAPDPYSPGAWGPYDIRRFIGKTITIHGPSKVKP